jgi:threonine dehydratase
MGVQIEHGDKREFQAFLKALGYTWVEETGNAAYRLFACGGDCAGSMASH